MKVYESISPELTKWILAQPVFFNATAPLAEDGHINLSPRGLDCLRILDPHTVVILDLTGSGNETAAHLVQNGRITLMFCAFSGEPRILRLYGRGEVILPCTPDWDILLPAFAGSPLNASPGLRQMFRIKLERIQISCGYGVPLMEFLDQRNTLLEWAENKGAEGIIQYRQRNNRRSIDGMPAPESVKE